MTRMSTLLAGAAALVALAGCSATPEHEEPGSEVPSPGATGAPGTSGASRGGGEGLRYVALGDSYTSAPGVGEPTGPQGCLRTDANYPHLLAERLGLELDDVSCGSATSRDLRSPQTAAGPEVKAQLEALTRETDLVTLSIGANDEGLFGALAVQCAGLGPFEEEAPCSASPRFAADRLDRELSALAQETSASVRAIRERAPKAQVVVVGYPQIVPASGTCPVLPIDAEEVPFVRDVNRRLAEALRRGARTAGVEYVDMWAASAGHDVCADEPWVAGLRPERPGAPLHPYAEHQAAVADELAALLD